MPDARFAVTAIGNAIVDIIAQCEDATLDSLSLPKGHMQLIAKDDIAPLYASMGPAVEISGGSAANTAAGLASLGSSVAFIGKVARDDFGDIFRHDIRSAGVTFETAPAPHGDPTARSLIFVTPDGERTMNTFLGVSPDLDHNDLAPDLIESAKITYLEGYLFDRAPAKKAFYRASEIASAAGRKVALSLSDRFCVERHREEFRDLVASRVDLLFANAEEICALYEVEDLSAVVPYLRGTGTLASITRGADGAIVVGSDKHGDIPAKKITEVVDTTGAGDLYAAGFLHGFAAGYDLQACARLGACAAAEVISHVGARPSTPLCNLAREDGLIK